VLELEQLLKEFEDVSTWTNKDLKGIPLELDTIIASAHQARYKLNPNYVTIVKQNIDKLLVVGFIQSIKEATWLSPIVVVPQKNGKLKICINFRKLNATKKKDPYPLLFKGEMLNTIEGYEEYYFLDGYLRYHKIFIVVKDIYKIAFVMDWGVLYGRSCCLELKMDLQHIIKLLPKHLENIWIIL
jgi:hypothetical protein